MKKSFYNETLHTLSNFRCNKKKKEEKITKILFTLELAQRTLSDITFPP